jgi:hypothetical protein
MNTLNLNECGTVVLVDRTQEPQTVSESSRSAATNQQSQNAIPKLLLETISYQNDTFSSESERSDPSLPYSNHQHSQQQQQQPPPQIQNVPTLDSDKCLTESIPLETRNKETSSPHPTIQSIEQRAVDGKETEIPPQDPTLPLL